MTKLQKAAKLAKYLRERSREICKDNGCRGDNHNCESYAYITEDLDLLDICCPGYLQGSSKPHAAVMLPFRGCGRDLIEEVERDLD